MVVSHVGCYVDHHVSVPDFITFLQWLLSEHCGCKANAVVIKPMLQLSGEAIIIII